MTPHERAKVELSVIIQPGDALTLSDGTRYIAAGTPANPSRYRGGTAWIVSIKAESCYLPISLGIVTRVERDGRVVWRLEDERVPVQRSLM